MTKPRTTGMPTLAEISSRLSYDPESGAFTWIAPGQHRMVAGQRAGQVLDSGYRSICLNRHCILEHRLAWFLAHGYWPTGEIDHINRVRTDNRIANLREVTSSQNSHNTERSAQPKAGERGLTFRSGCWHARISFQGKEIHLGSHEVRDVARLTRALAKDRALRGARPLSHADFADVRKALTGEIHEVTA